MTSSYAYVDGKLVTALSEAEHKMCTAAKKIQTNVKNAVNGMPEPVKQLTTFLGGFADSVLQNVLGMDIGSEPYSQTYQTTYNKGEIAGDIGSILLGIASAMGGMNLIQKGGSIAIAGTAMTGQVQLAGGAGAAAITLGIVETAAGIKITISASKKLGEDIGKLRENSESLPNQGTVKGDVKEAPKVDAGKQGKHVEGHANYQEGKSTWKSGTTGVNETQNSWQNGKELPDGTKVWDTGKIIGKNGETGVRVHIDKKGNIHGYPVNIERYLK